MLVRTIIDKENGRKWEIIEYAEEIYTVQYYELFKDCGWKQYKQDNTIWTKEAIEIEFGIKL